MAKKKTGELEYQPHKLLTVEEGKRVDISFSDNARKIMKKRYLVTRDNGTQETPSEMLHRIAHAVAGVEKKYAKKSAEEIEQIEREFFYVMANKEFTPAGRTITNAGAPSPVVANCIVLPIDDSMDGIFKTLKDAALLQKAGSGLGFSFGRLRPAGTFVKASAGMASGPVSFLQVYNQAFGVIKQQGRHGANMAILPVDHPDILDFIHCKEMEGQIRNFNISVGITDEFMKAVIEHPDEPWMCRIPSSSKDPNAGKRVHPRRITRDQFGIVTEIVDEHMTARQLYGEIVQGAWRNGEPGVVFLDAVNRTNPLPGRQIEACNPCGEQFLSPYDVCNLGSINLAAFVKNGKLDLERLKVVSRLTTRFLDNVIDLFDYPVKEVQKMSRDSRRLGLGVMGFADMLYQMGVGYDSEEGLEAAELVMKTIQDESAQTSIDLADEKAVFPLWEESTYAKQGIKRRNTMVTTVAPTGTISMFFDTSSGIEPNFALAFTKQDKDGHIYKYVNKYLEQVLRDRGLYTEALMDKIVLEGSVANMPELPEDIRRTFRVSMDISATDHIRAQAAFQKYVENSISKTINFPNEATVKDIEDAYIMAWTLGCKGCTLYRDGSREIQVLNLNKNLDKAKSLAAGKNDVSMAEMMGGSKPEVKTEAVPTPAVAAVEQAVAKMGMNLPVETPVRKRPEVMHGMTHRISTPYGNLYVTVNEDENGPFEVFAILGKAGGFFQAQSEAICRLLSLALRSNIPSEQLIEQLKGIRGPDPMFNKGSIIYSLPDAIAHVLEEHVKSDQQAMQLNFSEQQKQATAQKSVEPVAVTKTEMVSSGPGAGVMRQQTTIADTGHAPVCPDCGSMMQFSEGCMKCNSCGFSKCG